MELRAGVDPAFALALAHEQGWAWNAADAHRRFLFQPEGAFTAIADDGTPVGIVACVVWPSDKGALAWIGSMVVSARHRRHGAGRTLLRRAIAHAEERGAEIMALDATEAGQPVYASEGFREVARTTLWARPPGAPRPAPGPSGAYAIYPVSPAEIMELLAYDRPRFGANRGPWLAQLISDAPHRSFVAVHRSTGAFSGLALGLADRIGPVLAEAPEAAEWLVHACESAGTPPRLIPWRVNAEALRVVERAGYLDTGRGCTRMVRGGPLPFRDTSIYAAGHFAFG